MQSQKLRPVQKSAPGLLTLFFIRAIMRISLILNALLRPGLIHVAYFPAVIDDVETTRTLIFTPLTTVLKSKLGNLGKHVPLIAR